MKRRLHGLTELPSGKTLGDVIPAFAGVTDEFAIGIPNQQCAGCSKPFDRVRKPRRAIRLYPLRAPVPIAFSYNLCGACVRKIRGGGNGRESVLAAVDAFHHGVEASQ